MNEAVDMTGELSAGVGFAGEISVDLGHKVALSPTPRPARMAGLSIGRQAVSSFGNLSAKIYVSRRNTTPFSLLA